ncbi:hypothetical protein CYMTET_34137 [Cymbomonas tetramitiformis]|uniref:Uncharacterized protein n=1 Tax=Cymbomonas tetramitiformis TaxID=36881 RepID=A0AAE0KQ56_9CHLO|nr:hypothetical protein CYMTET_34137 [Cymbomonas tetramitiformis]
MLRNWRRFAKKPATYAPATATEDVQLNSVSETSDAPSQPVWAAKRARSAIGVLCPQTQKLSDVFDPSQTVAPKRKLKPSSLLQPWRFRERHASLVALTGNDIIGHCKRYLNNASNGVQTEFLDALLNDPNTEMKVPQKEMDKCAAVYNDLLLSSRKYELLRKHQPEYISYAKLAKYMQSNDPELVELKRKDGTHGAWAVRYIQKDIIIPELEALRLEGVDITDLEYKFSSDNFGSTGFNLDTKIPNEQVLLYILRPGEKTNSILRCRPGAFAHNQAEDSELTRILFEHIDPQLPRPEETVNVTDPTTGAAVAFTLTDFLAADNSFANYMYAIDGPRGTWGCIHGIFCRFSAKNTDGHNCKPMTDPAHHGTLERMKELGRINMFFRDDMTLPDLKQKWEENKTTLEGLFRSAAMPVPNLGGNRGGAVRKVVPLVALINRACRNRWGLPVTKTPPTRSPMDSCHWFINIAKTWRAYLELLAKQISVNLCKEVDEIILRMKRPMMG